MLLLLCFVKTHLRPLSYSLEFYIPLHVKWNFISDELASLLLQGTLIVQVHRASCSFLGQTIRSKQMILHNTRAWSSLGTNNVAYSLWHGL